MTSETAREIQWAGGTHTFNLNHPWVRQVLSIRGLPGDFGSTPAACFKRFNEGIWGNDDVERVIELGLIGGGLSDTDAEALVNQHVRSKPVLESSALAMTVLSTLFVAAPEKETTDNG